MTLHSPAIVRPTHPSPAGGLWAAAEAGAVSAVVALVHALCGPPPQLTPLLAAAADFFCTAASEPAAREPLAEAGAVEGCSTMLLAASGSSPQHAEIGLEITVRSLLALGMLVGGEGAEGRRARLAAVAGVGERLRLLSAGSSDADVKQLAAELAAALMN